MPPRVYAHRDIGAMIAIETRWSPRRVQCTDDAAHTKPISQPYVVKFRRTTGGVCVGISELVCGFLLQKGGIKVPRAALVSASPLFATALNDSKHCSYSILPGWHFGTVLMDRVENGPPLHVKKLIDPQQLVNIWAFDTWFCNIDRKNHGNFLMEPVSSNLYSLIAADQSDCFRGTDGMAKGLWKDGMESFGRAETARCCPAAILENGGSRSIKEAIDRVREAAKSLDAALSEVPQEWWSEAKIDGNELKDVLVKRARKLDDILGVSEWDQRGFEGAILLGGKK